MPRSGQLENDQFRFVADFGQKCRLDHMTDKIPKQIDASASQSDSMSREWHWHPELPVKYAPCFPSAPMGLTKAVA